MSNYIISIWLLFFHLGLSLSKGCLIGGLEMWFITWFSRPPTTYARLRGEIDHSTSI